MTPERWQHIKSVVGDALELDPPERARFVQSACGNDTRMRSEIESLLEGSGEKIEAFADDLDVSLRPALAGFSNARGSPRNQSTRGDLDIFNDG